jgi:hypothetical protein
VTPEERIELETVNHRARVSWAFVLFVLFVVGAIFWITETPKRWLVPLIALACGLGLYAALR